MSENKSNKNMLFAAVAGVALIGAAILYSWSSHDADADDEDDSVDLRTELKNQELDKCKKQGPILEGQYFLFLLNFIGVQSQARMMKKKKALDAERRGHLKSKNDSAYTECVAKMCSLREGTQMSMVKEICEIVGCQEQEFMMSLETYASNPQMAQFIQAAQGGKLKPNPVQNASLSKEKVLACIDHNIEMFKNPETQKKM